MRRRQVFTGPCPARSEASALWGLAAAGMLPGRSMSDAGSPRQTFELWLRRARTRRQLGVLGDRELRDVGLDRAAAAREANKPFWMA
ncbi:uncharacterized protein YjiS (DUF1127 family) [Inquilinus ginsengisoli]|jgi:uncharacterized protein YjiS (DUF1127 family)|uniref:DUF1127 domain-containing protein n=1 Tax=Inquilinus ginsengisoli TaxID=363840 RepID=UPI003D1FAA35